MSNEQDERETTLTTPAPAPASERDTNPPGPADEAAARVLETMLPPRAPATLEDSYLDKAIRIVAQAGARMAEDRAERQAQHAEVMGALRDQNSRQDAALGKLAHELNTNLDLLSEAFKRHQRASDARLAEGDLRFTAIEESLEQIKADMRADAEKRLADVERIAELERLLDELKKHGTARPQAAPAAPQGSEQT